MASNISPPRRKTLNDINKDNNLAQWTSEIRKLQTEVDMEAAEEARRLEEEIAASRIERERRRTNNRRSVGHGESPEEVKSSDVARALNAHTPSDLSNTTDRQRAQMDALDKLHGEQATPVTTPVAGQRPSLPAKASSMPTSLASIIGGTATGPRLNKHAPQVDAHDPSQFAVSQRVDGPSPSARLINASSGVALPGLQTSFGSPKPRPNSSLGFGQTPVQTPVEPKPPITLPSTSTAHQNTELGSLTQTPRQMPSVVPPSPLPKPTPLAPSALSPPIQSSRPASTGTPFFRPGETRQAPQPASPPSDPPLPSLARPIQPSPPAPSPQLPVSQSVKASPAFLRTLPPSKDLTPSLTRLQGRGFVSQRVQLVGTAPSPQSGLESKNVPASPTTSASGTGRKLDVLSRWPAASTSTTSVSESRPKPAPSSGTNKISFNPVAKSAAPVSPSPSFKPSTTGMTPPKLPVSSPLVTPAPEPQRPKFARQNSPGMAFALPGLSNGKPPPNSSRNETDTALKPGSQTSLAKAFALPGLSSGKSLPNSMSRGEVSASPKPDSQALPASGSDQPAHLSHPTRDRARKPKRVQGATLRATPVEHSAGVPAAASKHETENTSIPGPSSGTAKVTSMIQDPPQIALAVQSNHAIAEVHVTPAPRILSEPPVFVTPLGGPPLESFGPSTAEEVIETSPPTSVSTATWKGRVPQMDEMVKTDPPEKTASSLSRVRILPGLSVVDVNSISSDGTGTSRRRSVMEIAQGLQAAAAANEPPTTVEPVLAVEVPEEEVAPKIDVRSAIASWGRPTASAVDVKHEELPDTEPEPAAVVDVRSAVASWARSDSLDSATTPSQPSKPFNGPIPRNLPPSHRDPIKAERRRSNLQDKYASIILPSLVEENTPAPTPFGSIARRDASATTMVDDGDSEPRISPTEPSKRPPSAFIMHQALLEHKALIEVTDPSPAPSPAPTGMATLVPETAEEMVEISVSSDPMNRYFDVKNLAHPERRFALPPNLGTISVEVLLVTGKSTSPISIDPHIFYDGEVRAIIHRYKSIELVSTRIFGWRGRQAEVGQEEAEKLGELATRFRTSLDPCIQGSEPEELVSLLGGVLITRQGPRAHWTKDNTSMHCVRAVRDVVFIDQVEPDRKNLCSAFSYVATLLNTIYVFHGKGATDRERSEASKYANSLLSDGTSPKEFEEGEEDEMFSMILGEDNHAMADFWKYRSVSNKCAADLFRIESMADDPVQRLDEVAAESIDPSAVFVLDGTFEIFVIVGADARQQRQDIHLALSVAQASRAQMIALMQADDFRYTSNWHPFKLQRYPSTLQCMY
ncbi:hypothetical protein FRB93_001333 [Tulasnella sp. JGI-2019a]|nr:hypothetical protein FRB93_001333 [Tulasnella sp. JGI-2019a]